MMALYGDTIVMLPFLCTRITYGGVRPVINFNLPPFLGPELEYVREAAEKNHKKEFSV